MLTLYSQQDSGNCYKPRLLLAHLGLDFKIVDIDTMSGETRQPAFVARSPIGKVPLLEFNDGRTLAESNAILLHLAEGTPLLPDDPYDRAKVYEWLFFEQYSHEPAIAVRRSDLIYPQRAASSTTERLARLLEAGEQALAVLELRLSGFEWLAGNSFSIADIALFAYTHVAHEGGFDLKLFPGIRRWLERVDSLPGHRPMAWRPA